VFTKESDRKEIKMKRKKKDAKCEEREKEL
jgi:hypothetical protein